MAEFKKAAVEHNDNTYSFIKNPLEDGESGIMCESDEPAEKKAKKAQHTDAVGMPSP